MANESNIFAQADELSGRGGRHFPEMATGAEDGHDWGTATAELLSALAEAAAVTTLVAQQALTYAELLDEALAILEEARGNSGPPEPRRALIPPGEALSPREIEVLALVAEGRSNKAIAEALFVSPNTVKTHVGSLLSKLRVESRVQLATLAHRRALVAGTNRSRRGT